VSGADLARNDCREFTRLNPDRGRIFRMLARNQDIPTLAHAHACAGYAQGELGNDLKVRLLQPAFRPTWIDLKYESRHGGVANHADDDLRREWVPCIVEATIQQPLTMEMAAWTRALFVNLAALAGRTMLTPPVRRLHEVRRRIYA